MNTFIILAAVANLALGKQYTLEPAPNYDLCTDEGDRVQLTDGELRTAKDGGFWTSRTTVGWKRGDVAITVDLGKREPIAGFGYNLAAGSAGVSWPRAVDVYYSDDCKTWRYAGDVYVRSTSRTGAPDPTRFDVYHAVSMDMPCAARYVMFRPSVDGYSFVDEVEVFKGPDSLLAEPPRGAVVTNFKDHFVAKCLPQKLEADLKRLESADPARAAILRPYAEHIPTAEEMARQTTELPLNKVHAKIWTLNSFNLRKAGFDSPRFWRNPRWENLDPLAIPPAGEPAAIKVEVMRGETRSEALNIVNPTFSPLECELEVAGFPSAANLRVYEVVFTDTKDMRAVSSALRGGKDARVVFTIPAGASKQVWISFRGPELEPGEYSGTVRAAVCGRTLEHPISLKVAALEFPKAKLPPVCGWDYNHREISAYNGAIRSGANQAANIEVMRGFGMNVPVGSLSALDPEIFRAWRAKFPWCDTFMVFVAADSNGGAALVDRVLGFEKAVIAAGLDPKKQILQIVDESHEKKSDDAHLALAKAIRAKTSGFRLFYNPMWSPTTAGNQECYDYADVVCVHSSIYGDAKSRAFFKDLAARGKEVWKYSCIGPVRLFDPLVYYRFQAWDSFSLGGIGGSLYWAFGCGGGIADSWRTYAQTGIEYGPYFVSPTDATPSKSSEAILEGAEDVVYLKLLGERGEAAVAERAIEKVRDSLKGELSWLADRDRELVDRVRVKLLWHLCK